MKITHIMLFSCLFFSSCFSSKKEASCFEVARELSKRFDNIIINSNGNVVYVTHSIRPSTTAKIHIVTGTPPYDNNDFYFRYKKNPDAYNKILIGARDKIYMVQKYGPRIREILPTAPENDYEKIPLQKRSHMSFIKQKQHKDNMFLGFFSAIVFDETLKLSYEDKAYMKGCIEGLVRRNSFYKDILKALMN